MPGVACARRVHGVHLEQLRGEIGQGPQGAGGVGEGFQE